MKLSKYDPNETKLWIKITATICLLPLGLIGLFIIPYVWWKGGGKAIHLRKKNKTE